MRYSPCRHEAELRRMHEQQAEAQREAAKATVTSRQLERQLARLKDRSTAEDSAVAATLQVSVVHRFCNGGLPCHALMSW